MEVHPIKTTSSSMHCSQSADRDTINLGQDSQVSEGKP